ncbi:MAG: hypothetical protein LBQ51_02665 [Desulfovibrio sp.]|jgi:hypothetical protein|nr:hypothetical protein [Desulfovibrio sp.]
MINEHLLNLLEKHLCLLAQFDFADQVRALRAEHALLLKENAAMRAELGRYAEKCRQDPALEARSGLNCDQ